MKRGSPARTCPSRRRLLKQLATGALLASTPAGVRLFSSGASGRGSANTARTTAFGTGSGRAAAAGHGVTAGPVDAGRIKMLSELLRAAPREKVFRVAVEQIQAGAGRREMLGGVLLAGVHDVKPRPPGTKFHVVLMVPSALALSQGAGNPAAGTAGRIEDPWLPIFFNIEVLKNSQERDISEGDWELPPAPPPMAGDAATVRQALVTALEEWDESTAETAAVAAVRLLDLDDLFEVFWPMGARDFHNIGHKMIHTSQVYRALKMMDGHHREPVIRSLVYGLLGRGRGDPTVDFEANRKRIAGLPDSWDAGRPDPDASGEMFSRLAGASATQAVEMVTGLLARGVAPASIWDGLRLIASEMLFRLARSSVRNAQLLGVHPMTILNSFYFASTITRRDKTRRLLLLQAAAWMPRCRDVLREAKGLSMRGKGLDDLEKPDEPVSIETAVQTANDNYVRSAALVLGATAKQETAGRFIDRCRFLVAHKSPEHHHHKYAAAVFEEHAFTHPCWAPYLLAPCLSYLPAPADADSDVTRRSRAALDSLRA